MKHTSVFLCKLRAHIEYRFLFFFFYYFVKYIVYFQVFFILFIFIFFFLLDYRFWGTWAEHARQLRRYTHGSVLCFPSPLHPHLAFLPRLSLPTSPSHWPFPFPPMNFCILDERAYGVGVYTPKQSRIGHSIFFLTDYIQSNFVFNIGLTK